MYPRRKTDRTKTQRAHRELPQRAHRELPELRSVKKVLSWSA